MRRIRKRVQQLVKYKQNGFVDVDVFRIGFAVTSGYRQHSDSHDAADAGQEMRDPSNSAVVPFAAHLLGSGMITDSISALAALDMAEVKRCSPAAAPLFLRSKWGIVEPSDTAMLLCDLPRL